MTADDIVADRFEAERGALRTVAYRMLGSYAEADDAVQEAWLRLRRTDPASIDNLAAWLRTVVARVCLDMLRTRTSRREVSLESAPLRSVADPSEAALVADSVGLALLVVLETLTPNERLAFVLHDLFAMPFEEIAPVLGRTPAATRQLASRARRRVQGAESSGSADREVVEAFLAASRSGDLSALVRLLHPDARVVVDGVAASYGAQPVVGTDAVAETFRGRARTARFSYVDGAPGAAWLVDGSPRVVFGFTVEGSLVREIELLADPGVLATLALAESDRAGS